MESEQTMLEMKKSFPTRNTRARRKRKLTRGHIRAMKRFIASLHTRIK